MTLSLVVNGTEFTNFTEASAKIAIDEAVNIFSFTATSNQPQGFPVAVGDEIEVLADENTIITGFVMSLRGSHAPGRRDIDIQGASKSVDVADSKINSILFSTPISLDDVIKNILSEIGSDISVSNEVDDLADFEESELIAAKPGQGAFSLMEQYARKRQVFIRSGSDGNFLISRNSGEESGLRLTSKIKDDDNNVKSASITIDHNERFNNYSAISQQNQIGLAFLNEDPGAEKASDQSGKATDDDIRASRSCIFVAENTTDNDGLTERATWEANIRRARSLIYSAKVSEHTVDGQPWAVNKLVQVEDEWEGINAVMLISSIEFKYSEKGGSTTDVICVAQDSYTLAASEPQKQKSTNSLGSIFGG